jgi:hypothetical protein
VHAFDTEEFIGTRTPQCPGRTCAVSHCQALLDSVWLVSPPAWLRARSGCIRWWMLIRLCRVVRGTRATEARQRAEATTATLRTAIRRA